ncbi:hypothetical protein E0Z10_g3937 [Xylaria hypoxylon]|uniref:Metal homeostatis protein bsd2 n=1 Tax=Xylaria hypoxylon TaxID=37992 RepID=A0A4Z0YMC1_9PEZI|nr:hypothetical protein E0Z10_g3937 [Xylaria hypoxylon]
MTSRYERVNTQDDDAVTPPSPSSLRPQRIPNSPPPSFHSRSSSADRRRQNVDSDLADAFDTDDDDSDDEPDDRQRLVRGNSFPLSYNANTTTNTAAASSAPNSSTHPEITQTHPTQSQSPSHAAANNRAQPTTNSRIYGGGIQSDGVFSNMTARPERGEKVVEEAPPTYEQAAADAAPPYWETTILAPGFGGPDDVYIDGLPVGSVFSFLWNGMISLSFVPLVGFLLTYLLHATHAAKNGSLAGLGISIIQYGFYFKPSADDGMGGGSGDGYAQPPDPNSHDFDPNAVSTGSDGDGSGWAGVDSNEWWAYLLMIVGWFILIRSVSDYIRARRHEQLVLQSPDRGLGVPIIAEGERPETVV